MKTRFPYRLFIILGTARTGSTLLWSYLNSHPDILCLRGIFGSTNKINFGKFYGDLPEECQSKELIKLRNERPVEFLNSFIWKEYSKLYSAVGFKYFYDHNRHQLNKSALTEYFKLNTGIKCIHLKRDNLLAALFSYKRALYQKQWQNADPDYRVSIPIEECNKYFVRILESQKQYDELFKDRILEINYNNLINNTGRTLEDILEFIGVEKMSLTTETIKNKEVKLSDCIMNYKELQDHFAKSDYAAYFDE